jgi:uroporphyrinogen-III decarboxylase
MRREETERIPVVPNLTHDMATRVYASDVGRDWLDVWQRCLENPAFGYELLIRLVREVGCDGLRLFPRPAAMKIERIGDDLIGYDPKTGDRLGKIDTHGGGYLVLDQPLPPVETLAEAQERLDEMVAELSAEKMDILRQARDKVPDLWVSSSAPGVCMNTYTNLRGREQAMIDLYDRPDFVHAVMDKQVEAAIKAAEKLLATGIDAIRTGGASSSNDLISPRHFEQFCLPAEQKFIQHFRGKHLTYICIPGKSHLMLEMLADSGADMIEPLDPLGGVSVADAKRRVGHRSALMGGVDTLTLAHGTPEEVQTECIQKCREGGPFGYVLGVGDMVPGDTPLENLQAMVDVATRSLWKEARESDC